MRKTQVLDGVVLVVVLSLGRFRGCLATDCCTGKYAPLSDGCVSNTSTYKCVSHIGDCEECLVSDEWSPHVECSRCCARRDDDGCNDDGEEYSLAWILTLVVSLLFCVMCGGFLARYEQRRRRDGITVAQAYRITSPLAEAQVSNDHAPKPEDEDEDLPVAQATNPAEGVPVTSPLELGGPVSTRALIESSSQEDRHSSNTV